MGGCNNGSSSGHHDSSQSTTSSLWYVGVIVSVVGSICTNMGVNLQKYSFMNEAKRAIKLKRSYLRQPFWVIGIALVIGGSGLDFLALGFLPQSLATPVGGTTMVANVVFASLFLKERFSRVDAMGTFLVLVGICVVAAFAKKESDCYNVSELVSLYGEPLFIMYMVVMAFLAMGLYLLTKRIEFLFKRYGPSSRKYKRFARLHPISYPALSGVFGAQSVLFAKSIAELIKTSADGSDQFMTVGTYVIAISMFVCIFLQIHWLAHGLQSFDAVFIVPVFQCFFISVSIFGGGVYFKEFAAMSTISLAMFFMGAMITLSGVFILSKREMNVLKASGKFRACVKVVIFIKRVQRARSIDHTWVQPDDMPLVEVKLFQVHGEKTSPRVSHLEGAIPPRRASKASVMPVDTLYPPSSVQQSTQSNSKNSGTPNNKIVADRSDDKPQQQSRQNTATQ